MKQTKEAIIAEKIAVLRKSGGYSSIKFFENRIVVVVDDSRVNYEFARLARVVWGEEWPTVRSSPWDDTKPIDAHQCSFQGRG